jgi:hypothetical protein
MIAFVLTVLQLEAQTVFNATISGIEYESASLFGRTRKFVPLSRVASMTVGVHRPIGYMIAAGILMLLGVTSAIEAGSSIPLIVLVVFAIVLVIAYFLGNSVLFEISSNAGREISLRFKPGVLENVPVDLRKALDAAAVIRDLILGKEPAPTSTDNADNTDQFLSSFDGPVPHAPPPVPMKATPLREATAGPPDGEQKAHEMLRQAVQHYNSGRRPEAVALMKRVVEAYPHTSSAATAAANLKKIAAAT